VTKGRMVHECLAAAETLASDHEVSGQLLPRVLATGQNKGRGLAMGDRVRGKAIIVTGAGSIGPGMGNGKAASILYAREGGRVLLVDRDAARRRRGG